MARRKPDSVALFRAAKFDDQGRRLLPTRGLPKDLLRDVMEATGNGWTTDEIRRACDVLDEWAGEKMAPVRPASTADNDAVNYMFSVRKEYDITARETLAKMALKAGLGRRAYTSKESNVKRLANALRSIDRVIAARQKAKI